MKTALGCIILLSGVAASLYAEETYTLTINGVSNTVLLGEAQSISLPDGQELDIRLSREPQHLFSRPMFSFSQPAGLRVNTTSVGEGVDQSLLATPKGTLILIQEYTQMNPADVVEVMLKEITKDEELAGYDRTASGVTRRVGDKDVNGRQSISSSGHQSWVREVYSISSGESGVLIVTAIENRNNAREQEIIDDFWATLSLTLISPAAAADAEPGQ